MRGAEGLEAHKEGREIVEMLAELPDLWDVNVAEWHNDSITSRFSEEGHQEPFVEFVKKVTYVPWLRAFNPRVRLPGIGRLGPCFSHHHHSHLPTPPKVPWRSR
jgi:hypothetical protein